MPGSEVMDDVLESRRASSRGLIPKAKVKTIKMTFVIITGYSLSEVLILTSINPKYDNRLPDYNIRRTYLFFSKSLGSN